MKIFASALILACMTLPALAQDKAAPATSAPAQAPAAPAAAPATPVAEAPKHNCAQPTNPGRTATVKQDKQFRDDVDAYRNCLIAFSGQMQAEANARIKAANGAVEEYNGYIKVVNDQAAEDEQNEATKRKAQEVAKTTKQKASQAKSPVN